MASAWSLRGRPLPFEATPLSPSNPGRLQALLADPHGRDAAAAIPVERIAGPILTAAGGMDQLWTSVASARAIAARRRAHGVAAGDRTYVYAAAGHLVDGAVPSTSFDISPLDAGGDPADDAAARARLWPAILAFLHGMPPAA